MRYDRVHRYNNEMCVLHAFLFLFLDFIMYTNTHFVLLLLLFWNL